MKNMHKFIKSIQNNDHGNPLKIYLDFQMTVNALERSKLSEESSLPDEVLFTKSIYRLSRGYTHPKQKPLEQHHKKEMEQLDFYIKKT